MKNRAAAVAVGLLMTLVALWGCVHTELIWRDFQGKTLYVEARVAPNARIDASYYFEVEKDDPLGTVVNIGTSAAKAVQVEEAKARLDRAMRRIDLEEVIGDELGQYFSEALGMTIVTAARRASYRLVVDVGTYGINAYGGSYFVLDGQSTLHDESNGRQVWGNWFATQQEISPDVFGLPAAAEQILSATMLAELDEEEMIRGIDRVTREAAWQIGRQFEDDLYRAHRERE